MAAGTVNGVERAESITALWFSQGRSDKIWAAAITVERDSYGDVAAWHVIRLWGKRWGVLQSARQSFGPSRAYSARGWMSGKVSQKRGEGYRDIEWRSSQTGVYNALRALGVVVDDSPKPAPAVVDGTAGAVAVAAMTPPAAIRTPQVDDRYRVVESGKLYQITAIGQPGPNSFQYAPIKSDGTLGPGNVGGLNALNNVIRDGSWKFVAPVVPVVPTEIQLGGIYQNVRIGTRWIVTKILDGGEFEFRQYFENAAPGNAQTGGMAGFARMIRNGEFTLVGGASPPPDDTRPALNLNGVGLSRLKDVYSGVVRLTWTPNDGQSVKLGPISAAAIEGEAIRLAKRDGNGVLIVRFVDARGEPEVSYPVAALPASPKPVIVAETPARPAPPDDFGQQIREAVAKGDKIQAIKRYRDFYGVGLADAKNAVEGIAAGQTWGDENPAAIASGSLGPVTPLPGGAYLAVTPAAPAPNLTTALKQAADRPVPDFIKRGYPWTERSFGSALQAPTNEAIQAVFSREFANSWRLSRSNLKMAGLFNALCEPELWVVTRDAEIFSRQTWGKLAEKVNMAAEKSGATVKPDPVQEEFAKQAIRRRMAEARVIESFPASLSGPNWGAGSIRDIRKGVASSAAFVDALEATFDQIVVDRWQAGGLSDDELAALLIGLNDRERWLVTRAGVRHSRTRFEVDAIQRAKERVGPVAYAWDIEPEGRGKRNRKAADDDDSIVYSWDEEPAGRGRRRNK